MTSHESKDKRKLPIGVVSVLLLLILLNAAHADPLTLKQVHVITRHGSRHPLPKDALTLEEETTETSLLTPIGQQQQYQLGVWLRERYQDTDQQFADAVLEQYSPNRVYIESSAYERTLVSAQSLALGLFPPRTRGLQLIPDTPPVVPIYTPHARHNDIVLRAYDKCPAFLENVEKLYDTDTFQLMEVDTMPLLRRLAQIPVFEPYVQDKDGPYIALRDLWNVYDAIHVAKTECPTPNEPSDVCKHLPDPTLATSIAEKDWQEIQQLAHAIELLKYGKTVAQNYVGGPLWNHILQRMLSDNNELMTEQFFVTSAHYPTILGLFAALNINFNQEMVIPEYAAALLVEVYQDEGNKKRFVKLFYKPGNQVKAVPLNHCQEGEACPMEAFQQMLQPKLLTNQEWCKVCRNIKADVCIQQQLNQLQQQQQQSSSSSCSSDSNNNTLAGLFFAGVLTMAMITMIVSTFCPTRRNRRAGAYNTNYGDDDDPTNKANSFDNVKPPTIEMPPNGHMNGNHHNMNGGNHHNMNGGHETAAGDDDIPQMA